VLGKQIAIQAMLQQKNENVLDKIEVRTLLNITIDADGEVFTDGENENVKWSEIGAI
jgi:hypothetical protein